MAREFILHLDIDSRELLRYYRGEARAVIARASNGQRCQFPVDALKPFVTHGGVQGTFRLRVDDNGKLLEISRQPP